jgi:hypothetical protein
VIAGKNLCAWLDDADGLAQLSTAAI